MQSILATLSAAAGASVAVVPPAGWISGLAEAVDFGAREQGFGIISAVEYAQA